MLVKIIPQFFLKNHPPPDPRPPWAPNTPWQGQPPGEEAKAFVEAFIPTQDEDAGRVKILFPANDMLTAFLADPQPITLERVQRLANRLNCGLSIGALLQILSSQARPLPAPHGNARADLKGRDQ